MSGFNLPANFNSNPEALLRKKRTRAISSSAMPPTVEPITPAPSVSTTMARSLHDYSTTIVANVPVGPAVNNGNGTSSFTLAYSRWCMQTSSVVCQLRMQTRIYRTSLSYANSSSSRMSKRQAPLVSLLPLGEGEAMVLPEQGSCQHMGQMFHDIPREIFHHEKNKCSKGKDIKLPADFTRIHLSRVSIRDTPTNVH